MASQDAQLMAQTFGAGAGSMGGQGMHKETQMQMRIEILAAKEERLAKKLQHTTQLYRNAEKSLIISEQKVNELEDERNVLVERNYEYKNMNIQL